MPKETKDGSFYEFRRDQPNREIGLCISRNQSLWRVRNGGDVYTPAGSDARSLAKDVQKGAAQWEGAHEFDYFPHFHAAANHEDYGHIFYGERGYRLGERRD